MSRRKGRFAAVQILYQLEMNSQDTARALDLFWENYSQPDEHPDEARDFASRIAHGAWEQREQIDALITKTARNWSFERITPIDLSILRIARYEILYCDDIPYKVTLNEAIELGKNFGSDKSGAFINGILDNITLPDKPAP